ncbi:MAG: ACP S-malonyltransferase [Hungatella sp.]|jgi:[acyl-carrier-protein] S-malonyltransferase|nr:ACP S-malonyltransferase [Hungatella sp.]
MNLRKTAFVFPGQGSQYQGMGMELYKKYPFVRNLYEQASALTGIDMENLCFHSDMEILTQTDNAQLAIFITSYAAFRVFMEMGVEPSFLSGHSLGEITALTCAGAITFEDAVEIVKVRGNLMQKAGSYVDGTMAAIRGIKVEELKEMCNAYLDLICISNYNSKDQFVISGDRGAVGKVTDTVRSKGGKCTLLKVSAPFHSPFMKEAAKEFTKELKKYRFYELKYPVISNVTSKPYEGQDDIVEKLSRHLTNPVQWMGVMDYLLEQKIEFVFEFGPGKVISTLINKHSGKRMAFSYDEADDRTEIQRIAFDLSGRKAEKEEVEQKLKVLFSGYIDKICQLRHENTRFLNHSSTAITLCLAHAVCTPNYNVSDTDYQNGVLVPYNKIRRLQAQIEREERMPEKEEEKEAFQMLYSIFQTKGVPYEEQELRLEKICKTLMIKDGI